jgi:hypothetical protein
MITSTLTLNWEVTERQRDTEESGIIESRRSVPQRLMRSLDIYENQAVILTTNKEPKEQKVSPKPNPKYETRSPVMF